MSDDIVVEMVGGAEDGKRRTVRRDELGYPPNRIGVMGPADRGGPSVFYVLRDDPEPDGRYLADMQPQPQWQRRRFGPDRR